MWGTWNGVVPRDAELVRRAATLLRHFGGERGLLTQPGWAPHSADVLDADDAAAPAAFGSRFGAADGERVYLVVNAADRAARARVAAGGANAAVFDCYSGAALAPDADGAVELALGPLDLGCAYVAPTGGAVPAATKAFLESTTGVTAAPLGSFSAEWTCVDR